MQFKKIFFIKMSLFTALFFAAQAKAGGVKVGNSGFTVMCSYSPNNAYSGYYSLDYLLTEPSPHLLQTEKSLTLKTVHNLEQSLERIQKILKRSTPSLIESFDEFKNSIFNSTNMDKLHIWEATPFNLINLDDQNFTVILPENCRANGFKGIPTIIKQDQKYSGTTNHIIYKYIPELIENLNQNNPIQLSFLLIHEWLWEISTNVERNRRINRFLHLERIETMSSDDIIKELISYGLDLPSLPNPIFDQQQCSGEPLTQEQFLKTIQNQFANEPSVVALGSPSVLSRQRQITCPAVNSSPDESCTLLWKEQTHPLLNQYQYIAFAQQINQNFTLNILSPELLQSFNKPILTDNKQIECTFVNPNIRSTYNLECVLKDFYLTQAITGLTPNEFNSIAESPTLKGKLTNDCLRIEYVGFYNSTATDSLTVQSENSVQNQIQTVLQIISRSHASW